MSCSAYLRHVQAEPREAKNPPQRTSIYVLFSTTPICLMSLIGFIPLDPRRSRANPPLLMITLLFKLNYSDEPDVYLKPLHRGSGPAQGHSGLLDLLSVLTLSTP